MATDAKKHSTIAAGEKPTRAALAAAILSINDVIPVANSTEATQVVVALAALGQTIASFPVVVARADARGAHRLEVTYDQNGLVWMPLSGVLSFATKTAADNFGAANPSLLTVNDECRVGSATYLWTGTAWQVTDTGWVTLGALASGWTVQSPDTADYRVLNNVLYLRGRLNATTGAAQSPILNTPLPTIARPAVDVPKLIGVTGGTAALFVTVVSAAGNLNCFKGSNAVGNLPLEGLGGIPVG